MTDTELIERLRSMSCYDYAAAREAADRLTSLLKENEKLREMLGSIDINATASARANGDIADGEFISRWRPA